MIKNNNPNRMLKKIMGMILLNLKKSYRSLPVLRKITREDLIMKKNIKLLNSPPAQQEQWLL